MASPYSAGGGGTHFEARVAASCFAAVLCEASVRGLPGGFAAKVHTQRAAFGDPLDDIVVTGVHQDGRATQIDLQIKNKITFTEDNEEWADVLKRAWDTFVKVGFDPVVHRIGVGIGTYNARVDQHYQSVLTWASNSTDGQHFRERIEKGDYSNKDKQAFVGTVRTVVAGHIGRSLTDDELWRFLAAFVIIHFDFQSGPNSRDAANVIDRLKGLLSAENGSQTARIWEHLVAKAGELIPAGGGAKSHFRPVTPPNWSSIPSVQLGRAFGLRVMASHRNQSRRRSCKHTGAASMFKSCSTNPMPRLATAPPRSLPIRACRFGSIIATRSCTISSW